MNTALWPDFAVVSKPDGIRRTLDEAGEELERKTGGRVVLRSVLADVGYDPQQPFTYECSLYVPKLAYSYFLLLIKTSVTGYPVSVTTGEQTYAGIQDDTRLREVLAETFHSVRTTQVVQNLLTMTA